MIHHVTRATRFFLFWLLIAAGVGSVLVRGALTGVENYKTELEQKFLKLTDIQLRIGSLRAGTRGLNPEIILKNIDVQSVDQAGKPAVQLKEVRVGIDVLQLLMNQNVLASSWVTLVGVKIDIIRQADGRITIKGLNAGKEDPLWLLKGGRYEFLQSEISWQDKKNNQIARTFNDFNLLLINDSDGRNHEIHLLSDLPGKYGESLRMSAKFSGDFFSADHINGRLYLEGKNIQFVELFKLDPAVDLKLDAGQGSFKIWSDWKNSRPYTIAGSIESRGIHLKRGYASLKLDQFDGTLSGKVLENQWRIDGYDLRVITAGTQWPVAAFNMVYSEEGQLAAHIQQLDLHEIRDLASFFLTDEMKKNSLTGIVQSGLISDADFYMDFSRKTYAVNGNFSNLTVSINDSIPELSGMTGYIRGTEEQGSVTLITESGRIFLTEIFRNPIAFERGTGEISWRQNTDFLHIKSGLFELDTAEIKTRSRLDLKIPRSERPVYIDLQTQFKSVGRVGGISAYLPAKIMDKEVSDWLDQAAISGEVRQGGLLLSGNLDAFPFRQGQGKFEVQFKVNQGGLLYDPEWPRLEKIDAAIHFLSNSLHINIDHAYSEHLTVKNAIVDIPELEDGDVLTVKGVVKGRVDEGLRFVQKTPLHARVDSLVELTDSQGMTQVDLDMTIPLIESADPTVKGIIHLKNARLLIKPVNLPLKKLTGDIEFSDQGVFSRRIDGLILGYPVLATIQNRQATVITVNGKTDMTQLKRQFPFLQKGPVKGRFSYTARLEIPASQNMLSSLSITTDLLGTEIDLPASLAKSARQKKQLSMKLQMTAGDYLPVSVNYADQLKVDLMVDKKSESFHSAYIVYGQGQPGTLNNTGVILEINQPVLNVSEWLNFSGTHSDQQGFSVLSEININTGQLKWNGEDTGKFQLALKRNDQYWQGQLTSLTATGHMRIPVELEGDKKIVLRMNDLDLTRLSALKFSESGARQFQIPLINLLSERVQWQGVNLGQLELDTERIQDGIRFSRVNITSQDHVIELQADWIKNNNGNSHTAVKGQLVSTDFGKLLDDFGFGDDFLETYARIDFTGDWVGAPYQVSLKKLQGNLNINLRDGRISSIEPGFGRILGLIAMEQWVKRFTLDFSDLYQKGLAFNKITGTLILGNGKAITDDLLIDAIAARVKITGETDLLEKDLDYRVLVVPKSSDAVPIAGTIVKGIAAVVTHVFTGSYKEGYFFGSEYKVEGKWGQAEITPMHDRDGLLKKTWEELTDFPWLKSPAD